MEKTIADKIVQCCEIAEKYLNNIKEADIENCYIIHEVS